MFDNARKSMGCGAYHAPFPCSGVLSMTKGQHGNKEAKKPKKVTPVVKSPATGTDAPTPPNGSKPVLQKR